MVPPGGKHETQLRDWELQFESMPIGCIVLDGDMRIVRYNRAFARTFGIDDSTDTTDLTSLVLPEDIREDVLAWLASLQDASEPVTGVNENLRIDGSRITCRWTNVPLRDDAGRFVGLMCMCEDVTESQRAERALASSEARYRTLFEQSSDAILAFDGTRHIVDANPEAVRMLGYTHERLLRLTLDRLLVYVGPDTVAAASGPVQRQRWRMLRADGKPLDADVGLRTLDDGTHIASIRNESGLHAAQRRIEWQRNLYDLLSRCAGEVARLEDKQCMYDAVTRIAVEHGGFRFAWVGEVQPDGSIAKVARYGADRGYIDTIEVSVLAHLPSGQGPAGRAIRSNAAQIANDFRADPHTAHWWEPARAAGIGSSAAIPLRVGGAAVAVLMVYSDEPGFFNDEMIRTLEQVATELSVGLDALVTRERLRESQHLLQTLIDGSPNPIFSFGADQRVMLANKSVCALFGLEPAQAIGLRRRDVLTETQAAADEGWDAEVLHTGVPMLVEQRLTFADGDRIFLTAKSPLRDTAGRIFAVGNVGTEITGLRKVELALQQAKSRLEDLVLERTRELSTARDRAERADRTKTAFMSTLSHELRSPLNSIIGFTDILRQGMSGPLTKDQDEQLAIVQESSRGMLALITELLDLSRIEAGKLVLEMQRFDVGELVQRRVQAMRALSDRKGLAFELDVPTDPTFITSDPKRVGQVVTNLMSNAIKFTSTGGVAVRLTRNEVVVSIDVEDTGPGIAPADLERIFEPFEQVGGAARRHDGTGLGLPIARQLARALGGDVTATCRLGRGCRFTVTLPLESPTAQTSTIAQPLVTPR
jgi:PAS domain S-box-containing protein